MALTPWLLLSLLDFLWGGGGGQCYLQIRAKKENKKKNECIDLGDFLSQQQLIHRNIEYRG